MAACSPHWSACSCQRAGAQGSPGAMLRGLRCVGSFAVGPEPPMVPQNVLAADLVPVCCLLDALHGLGLHPYKPRRSWSY